MCVNNIKQDYIISKFYGMSAKNRVAKDRIDADEFCSEIKYKVRFYCQNGLLSFKCTSIRWYSLYGVKYH